MSDVTQVLSEIEQGDPAAASRLFPLVYDELRKMAAQKMANERVDHTLQGTALVNEAYLRLVGIENNQHWNGRGHFFTAAAESMRRILIEHARSRSAQKRDGARKRVDVNSITDGSPIDSDLWLDVDAGLSRLAEDDFEIAELVKLRLFAGLSIGQAGEVLGMSRTTAYRNWDYVRSWFAVHG